MGAVRAWASCRGSRDRRAGNRGLVHLDVGNGKADHMVITDDAYRQLMKHAARLAMTGHEDLAGKSLDAEIDKIRQFENDEGRA